MSFESQATAFLSMQVGVCIDNVAGKMFNDYDVRVQPLSDLSIIANVKLAGPQRRWSLAALTEMITCKEVIYIALAIKHCSLRPLVFRPLLMFVF